MTRLLALSVVLVMALLLPLGITAAQDDQEALPPDVTDEMQARMDALTEGGLPPGMVA